MSLVIAYDFGTGGIKASLFDTEGCIKCESFETYETRFPQSNHQVQSPNEWWEAFVVSTKNILSKANVSKDEIVGLGISGHSLGLVPLDQNHEQLLEWTPIWSDSRATAQAEYFFESNSLEEWYLLTGNGFPPGHYPVFKLLWLKQNCPDIFEQISVFLGTKDFINFKLTGKVATDYSYASGTGIYDLKNWKYSSQILEATGLPASIFPTIMASDDVLGTLLPEVAEELGLSPSVKVVLGGVDNSCMALGAGNTSHGKAYNSLGSSSWIAVSSKEPILSAETKPFVFTHVLPELFTSATAIFSAGTSLNWYKRQIVEQFGKEVSFDDISKLATQSCVGANGLLFVPHLAGGSALDLSSNVKGSFFGLELKHTDADMARAVFEGITFALKIALEALTDVEEFDEQIRFVGGGSKSEFWMQLFADIFDRNIQVTNVNQQCAALGAAALAGVGCGVWKDYSVIETVHNNTKNFHPDDIKKGKYASVFSTFKIVNKGLAKINCPSIGAYDKNFFTLIGKS